MTFLQTNRYFLFLFLFPFFLAACSTNSLQTEEYTWHSWQSGDTLKKISRKYSVSVFTLRKTNEIYDSDDIRIGTRIRIPVTTNRIQTNHHTSSVLHSPTYNTPLKFIWPSRGTISSGFGLRHGRMHYGVDLTKDKGKAIFAAASGVVSSVGKLSGYGNTIILDHGNGLKTLYAHNRKIYVHNGMRIRQGTQIAEMGNTGTSTGPHLHFEIMLNGKKQNPLRYLPRR